MRVLRYSPGSPFARGIRVLLHELALEYDHRDGLADPDEGEEEAAPPTLQIPALRDNGTTFWESGLIADYLLATYPVPPQQGTAPLARAVARPSHEWEDKLVFATVQALGTAGTTISQLKWTGVNWPENTHLSRAADRYYHLLDWLELRLADTDSGFFGAMTSVQDIFLACHLGYIANRPLDLEMREQDHPRITALRTRMEARPSFIAAPVLWWDPDVTGYAADGVTPLYEKG